MPPKPPAAKPPTAPLPGSAAAAAPEAPKDPAAPVSARIDQAEANRIAAEKDAAKLTGAAQKPSLGRVVFYIAPDRHPRTAIIVRVWDTGEDAPAGAVPPEERQQYVNLVVYAAEPQDNQLLRQTALVRGTDGFSFFATQIPIAREAGDVHSWMWPPRV